MKTRTLVIGKSRLLRAGNLQTWLKAEVIVDFEIDPTEANVQEIIEGIDHILLKEEETENARWNEVKDQSRK